MSKQNDGPSNEIQIGAYLHCGQCVAERPADQSMAQWARINAGWTKRGLQVICARHNCNMLHVDFQGQKHPANTSAPKEALVESEEGRVARLKPAVLKKLLSGIGALSKSDFHSLNACGLRGLHVALAAYAKHHLDCPDIGWDQLGEMLNDHICNEIGDDEYIAWAERITNGVK